VRSPLSLAVAQPECVPGDARANGVIHARAVVNARARVVVFPELSLTGYELDAALVEPGDAALDPVVAACASTGSTALVGAPIPGPGGRAYIAMLAVSPGGVTVLYRKQWIGGDEAIRFSPGDEPTVFEVDGWRIGVGICRDTGIGEHVERMAGAGYRRSTWPGWCTGPTSWRSRSAARSRSRGAAGPTSRSPASPGRPAADTTTRPDRRRSGRPPETCSRRPEEAG
jgi:predicted amidohydrolase